MKNKKIVSYHGACVDGTAAAAVFKMRYPNSIFVPVKSRSDFDARDKILSLYGQDAESELYILDNPFFADDFAKIFKSLTIIDHHIGEFEHLRRLERENINTEYIFDNSKSGASLTWSFLFPDKDLPKLIWHVEDGDIWRMGDKYGTDLVYSYLSIYVDDLDAYINFINSDINDIYEKAEPVLEYKNMLLDYYIRNAQALHLKVGEHIIKAYNVASVRGLVSSFGNKMSEITKESIVMFKCFGDHVNLSFRSASDKFTPSALELAQSLGGNGHKQAAGASMPLKNFINSLHY